MIGVIHRRYSKEIIFQTASSFSILNCSPLEGICRHSLTPSAAGGTIKVSSFNPVKQGNDSCYFISFHRCHIKTHIKPLLIGSQLKQPSVVAFRVYGNPVTL